MATWDAAYINDLPDSAFACIDAGGERDDSGRTVQRSLRHYPHHNAAGNLDLPHLRAALSRVAQEATTSCGVGPLRDHAQEEDVGKSDRRKSAMPATPEEMRRHLMAEPPAGHGLDAADMEMTEMNDRHATMHTAGADHEHSGMMAASQPALKSFTPIDFKLSETGEVSLAFSRFMVIDKDRDVTFPGSLPVGKSVAMGAYGHTSWAGALPLGKGTIREQGDLGIFDGQFFMETDQGRNGYHTAKAMGDLQEWSYSYDVLPPSGPELFKGERIRALRKLDVTEVSPVLIGAGIGTHTLAIKSGSPGPDAPYAEHLSWLREAVEAFTDRTGEKAAWRASEGRGLSAATRAELADLVTQFETIDALAPGLAAILEATDPKRAERLHRTEIEVLLGTAQR